MTKRIVLAAFLAPFSVYGGGSESAVPRCEAETSVLMTTQSAWAELASAANALPERCFDGYFAEGISDTLVRKLATDWEGFLAVLDGKPSNGPFMNLILRSINESVDKKDIDSITTSAKERCPRRHEASCSAIIGRAGALQW